MLIRDIHNELNSYYQGTYSTKDNKLYYLVEIYPPDTDETDEEGDPVYDDDGSYEVETSMHLFKGICYEVKPIEDGRDVRQDYSTITLDKLDFSFPDVGLVNIKIAFDNYKFNIVKHTTRSATRQWRRALRRDVVQVRTVNNSFVSMIQDVTGSNHRELANNLTDNAIYGMYYPSYLSVDGALQSLTDTIGVYALNSEWWVGQGQHGVIFGYKECVCGDVDEERGTFKFEDTKLEFLKDSLIEVIGENRYEC